MITISSTDYYFDKGAKIQFTPRKRVVSYGDGYRSERALGLPKVVISAGMTHRENAAIDTVVAFLQDQAGAAFDVSLLGRTFTMRATEYSIQVPQPSVKSVTFTMEESKSYYSSNNLGSVVSVPFDRNHQAQEQIEVYKFDTEQADQFTLAGINSVGSKVSFNIRNRPKDTIIAISDYFYGTKGVSTITKDGKKYTLDSWTITVVESEYASLTGEMTRAY